MNSIKKLWRNPNLRLWVKPIFAWIVTLFVMSRVYDVFVLYNRPPQPSPPPPPPVTVPELVFTIPGGCEVYRFHDPKSSGPYYRYFSSCGSVSE